MILLFSPGFLEMEKKKIIIRMDQSNITWINKIKITMSLLWISHGIFNVTMAISHDVCALLGKRVYITGTCRHGRTGLFAETSLAANEIGLILIITLQEWFAGRNLIYFTALLKGDDAALHSQGTRWKTRTILINAWQLFWLCKETNRMKFIHTIALGSTKYTVSLFLYNINSFLSITA